MQINHQQSTTSLNPNVHHTTLLKGKETIDTTDIFSYLSNSKDEDPTSPKIPEQSSSQVPPDHPTCSYQPIPPLSAHNEKKQKSNCPTQGSDNLQEVQPENVTKMQPNYDKQSIASGIFDDQQQFIEEIPQSIEETGKKKKLKRMSPNA